MYKFLQFLLIKDPTSEIILPEKDMATIRQNATLKYISFLQQNVWASCWKEFKFAVDLRAGDTKPVEQEEDSNGSGSNSDDAKSEGNQLNNLSIEI